eukprot:6633914-Heterocapsa_arctica.AAC.1
MQGCAVCANLELAAQTRELLVHVAALLVPAHAAVGSPPAALLDVDQAAGSCQVRSSWEAPPCRSSYRVGGPRDPRPRAAPARAKARVQALYFRSNSNCVSSRPRLSRLSSDPTQGNTGLLITMLSSNSPVLVGCISSSGCRTLLQYFMFRAPWQG